MRYQVMVLSADEPFSRMLELEFRMAGYSVFRGAKMASEEDFGEVLLLDLDTVALPSVEFEHVIGFTGDVLPAQESVRRRCSLILHRPYEVALLRNEVSALLCGNAGEVRKPITQRKIRLDKARRELICDGIRVSLSPKEMAVLELLMDNRGKAVSKNDIRDAIGESSSNKAEVFVCYLRKKTDNLPGDRLIQTVRGIGYRMT